MVSRKVKKYISKNKTVHILLDKPFETEIDAKLLRMKKGNATFMSDEYGEKPAKFTVPTKSVLFMA